MDAYAARARGLPCRTTVSVSRGSPRRIDHTNAAVRYPSAAGGPHASTAAGGSKTYITNGHRADFIVLVTKTDPDAGSDGFTLFLVDMDLPGVVREKRLVKLWMHASDIALLAFQDVRVPVSAVLGEVGRGFHQIMRELQGERLIGAAGCVASAQRVFDQTLEYARQRRPSQKTCADSQSSAKKARNSGTSTHITGCTPRARPVTVITSA
jgi:alkylation response protein AidB-like acyl-CoA dehydrogenase